MDSDAGVSAGVSAGIQPQFRTHISCSRCIVEKTYSGIDLIRFPRKSLERNERLMIEDT